MKKPSEGLRKTISDGSKICAAGCDRAVARLDNAPLWLVGLVLFAVTFSLYFSMGEQCVFEIIDQWDESLLNYVLTAKHVFGDGADTFPELLNGVSASGMKPSDILALPLYYFFDPLTAFLIQYAFAFLCGFFGMYFCMKELTESSILSVAMAGCFSMLPLYSVYGLSQYGIPLILYAFLCLCKSRKIPLALVLTAVYGLSSHLVYTGYVVLAFWELALLVLIVRKKPWKWACAGFAELSAVYLFVNRDLISEILLGNSSYVSHREEIVKSASPFWNTVVTCFLESAQHAPSLHKYLILPIVLMLVFGFFKKKDENGRRRYLLAAAGFVVLVLIALFYGLCYSQVGADFRNQCSGFLHYFQAERFYWLYPAGWYLVFGLCCSVWWGEGVKNRHWVRPVQLILLVLMMLPTLNLIKEDSIFYRHVNQTNNGSAITGYVTWESYYAEDLMQELEDAIGRDMTTYRVAHLGISPAPSLMHGFYTVDGYSNNYPLEYKHRFRQVIAAELAKAPETAAYFDDWGNRCYLFNSQSGTYYSMPKGSGIVYEGLEFDMEALKDLGCEYLFSGGEILDAEDMGLTFMGYYETETSYWGIWLYALE